MRSIPAKSRAAPRGLLRTFKPVPSTFGIGFFKHQKTSHHIPDAQ